MLLYTNLLRIVMNGMQQRTHLFGKIRRGTRVIQPDLNVREKGEFYLRYARVSRLCLGRLDLAGAVYAWQAIVRLDDVVCKVVVLDAEGSGVIVSEAQWSQGNYAYRSAERYEPCVSAQPERKGDRGAHILPISMRYVPTALRGAIRLQLGDEYEGY